MISQQQQQPPQFLSNQGLSQSEDIVPNQTLYVSNLNEKIKVDELKQSLYFLCSPYGEIMDIVAKKNIKMRGQAFVIYRNIQSATNALRDLQGFNFFDKPLKFSFAKTKSDIVAKDDGTYQPREKSKEKLKEVKQPVQKKVKIDQTTNNQMAKQQNQPKQTKVAIAPNNILFVENLPSIISEEMLATLFGQYPGFNEVRLIQAKNVAFVEYDDELQAGIAMSGLSGFRVLPDYPLQISYAKK